MFDRHIIEQIIGQSLTLTQIEHLMHAGVPEICIDQQHGLRYVHGYAGGQIDRGEGLSLLLARTGHADDIPAFFPDPMHDLCAQNFEGIYEWPGVESGHNALFTQHRLGNLYRSRTCVDDGGRHGSHGVGTFGLRSGMALVVLLFVSIKRSLKPFHGNPFPYRRSNSRPWAAPCGHCSIRCQTVSMLRTTPHLMGSKTDGR